MPAMVGNPPVTVYPDNGFLRVGYSIIITTEISLSGII
jgi:hypothetical protein